MATPLARLVLPLLAVTLLAGCGGPVTLAQRLEGDWVGRPETERERILREWPGGATDADIDGDPELAKALAEAVPTDLSAFPDARVTMRLGVDGEATLSLGDSRREGAWAVAAGEAGRALLEIAVETTLEETANEPSPAAATSATEKRRFVVQFLSGEAGFTLIEQGADRRFGRLLFTPSGSD